MTVDKLYGVIVNMQFEINKLSLEYWMWKAGLRTEEELTIAYNKFRANTGCVCKEES